MPDYFLRQKVGTIKVVSYSAKVFLMQVKRKKKACHKVEVPIKASWEYLTGNLPV